MELTWAVYAVLLANIANSNPAIGQDVTDNTGISSCNCWARCYSPSCLSTCLLDCWGGVLKPYLIVRDFRMGESVGVLGTGDNYLAPVRSDCAGNSSFLRSTIRSTRFVSDALILVECGSSSALEIMEMVAQMEAVRWDIVWTIAFHHQEEVNSFLQHDFIQTLDESWTLLVIKTGVHDLNCEVHVLSHEFVHEQRQTLPRFTTLPCTGSSTDYADKWAQWSGYLKKPFSRHFNMMGRRLVAGGNGDYPWFGVKFVDDIPVADDGIDVIFVKTLGQALNFSFSVFMPPDGEWGRELPNGTFTGLTGAVPARFADIVANDVSMSEPRRKVIDFSHQYFVDDVTFITLGATERSRAFVIILPFTAQVWACIGGSAIVGIVAIKVFGGFEARRGLLLVYGKPKPMKKWKSCTSIAVEMFRLYLGSEMNDEFPAGNILRTFNLFLMFAVMTISALYAGVLTAYMTAPGMTPLLNSFGELAADDNFDFTMQKGTIYTDFFQYADEGSALNTLWKRLVKRGGDDAMSEETQEGFLWSQRPYKCYVEARYTIQYTATSHYGPDSGKYHIASQGLMPSFYGVMVRKGSPLKPVLDRKILQLQSGGFINHWTLELRDRAGREAISSEDAADGSNGGTGSSQETVRSLTVNDLQGSFYLLCIGYGFSVLSFFVEKVKRACTKKNDSESYTGGRDLYSTR